MRSARLSALLAKYGIEPCNDGSCMFGRAGGMHTNGGCRCVPRGRPTEQEAFDLKQTAKRMAAIIRELDEQSEQIAAYLDREAERVAKKSDVHALVAGALYSYAEDVRAGRWKERG